MYCNAAATDSIRSSCLIVVMVFLSGVREEEIPDVPVWRGYPGALLRCPSLMWLATRRSGALHCIPARPSKPGHRVFPPHYKTKKRNSILHVLAALLR